MVAQEVYVSTKGRQTPWVNTNLRKLVYFGFAAGQQTSDEALITHERRKLLADHRKHARGNPTDDPRVAASDKISLSALYGMLDVLNVDVSAGPEKLETQLRAGAENLRTILTERSSRDTTDPELIRLANLAERAEQEGTIKLAIQFRTRASNRADQISKILDQTKSSIALRRKELATTYARHAETSILAFDYETAAAKYASAFDQVVTRDTALAFHYKLLQGRALGDAGQFKGNRVTLERSVEVLKSAAELVPQDSLERGLAEHALANSLRAISLLQADPAILRKAIDTYQSALAQIKWETASQDWLTIQNDLAEAYLMLVTREQSLTSFNSALQAYTTAKDRQGKNTDPLAHASTNELLGDMLLLLAERTTGSAVTKDVIYNYEAALSVYDQSHAVIMSASLRNKIGNAYRRIAEQTGDARLNASFDEDESFNLAKLTSAAKAVAYFQSALVVRRREAFPLAWAESQNDLGRALSVLGSEQRDGNLMGEAIHAYEYSLTEFRRERAPLQWAKVQRNICKAKRLHGAFSFSRTILRAAIEACLASLDASPRDIAPVEWAAAKHELAEARLQFAILGSGLADIELAITEYEDALSIRRLDVEPLGWFESKTGFADALRLLGERARDKEKLFRARAEIDEATRLFYPEYPIESETEKQRVDRIKEKH